MILALIGALLIGLTLGLLGSGGSILTVPVLIYLVGEAEKVAIAESLGIVAIISLIGALPYAWERQIHWRSVLLFGLPGMAGTYGGAYLSQFMPGAAQLLLFAGVMLLAAVLMLRRTKEAPVDVLDGDGENVQQNAVDTYPANVLPDVEAAYELPDGVTVAAPRVRTSAATSTVIEAQHPRRSAWKIMLEGLGVGVLTGLVGVGGGFLIVPALVLLGGLNMRLAVGTSLLIISFKSLTGLYKYWDVLGDAGLHLNWNLILIFGVIGIVGSLIGSRAGAYVPQAKLKRGFAVFLLVMGVYILWQNLSAVM